MTGTLPPERRVAALTGARTFGSTWRPVDYGCAVQTHRPYRVGGFWDRVCWVLSGLLLLGTLVLMFWPPALGFFGHLVASARAC